MDKQDDDGLRVLERTLAAMGVAKGTRYSLLKRDGRVLCALPESREVALRTLSLYQPQRWKARVMVAVLRLITRLGWHLRTLPCWETSVDGELGKTGGVGVLVGSTGHLCDRAVVAIRGQAGWKVCKVAFGELGREILAHEAEMLRALKGKFAGAPALDEIRCDDGVTMLTMPWSEGGEWKGEARDLLPMLSGWRGAEPRQRLDQFSEWQVIRPVVDGYPRLRQVINDIREKEFVPTIRHGDLTRPNIRVDSLGALVVHDWERASLHGIPGMDLVFFLYQDRQFRSEEAPAESLRMVEIELSSGAYAAWLESQGWGRNVRELMALTFAFTTGSNFFDHRALLEILDNDVVASRKTAARHAIEGNLE